MVFVLNSFCKYSKKNNINHTTPKRNMHKMAKLVLFITIVEKISYLCQQYITIYHLITQKRTKNEKDFHDDAGRPDLLGTGR